MPDMHATEEELILHYYGESTERRVETHICSCAQCTQALDELRAVLSLVDSQPLPEPLAGLELRVWARVQPAIATRHTTRWSRWFTGVPSWALAGGFAALVIAAFVAGRATRPDVAPTSRVASTTTPTPPATATASNVRLITIAVGDHLDQSQIMLMQLLNGDARPTDLGSERERARDLVAANRLYRQIAVREGDEGVGEVLDALERVLVEIANAPPDVSARELEALRADIEQRGILFRLRVVASEMRAREQRDMMGSPETGP